MKSYLCKNHIERSIYIYIYKYIYSDIQSNLSNILAEDDDVDVNQKQLRLKVWIFDKDTMRTISSINIY